MQSQANKKMQAITVGGGVRGLTLALMPERVQVSPVLLDAYPSLCKPVDTAIGLFPDGLPILDQLGLLEEIEATGQRTRNQRIVDGETGRCLLNLTVERELQESNGYGIVSMARHGLLRVPERHLQAKDRLLTGKRVTSVGTHDGSADVRCEDVTQYSGQEAQYVAARESWAYECLGKYVMPRLSKRMHCDRYSSYVVGGLRLKEDPWVRLERAHSAPWEDEGRRKTMSRSAVVGAVFLVLFAGVWVGRNMIQNGR